MVSLVNRPDPRPCSPDPEGHRAVGVTCARYAHPCPRAQPLSRLLQQTERHASTCGERFKIYAQRSQSLAPFEVFHITMNALCLSAHPYGKLR